MSEFPEFDKWDVSCSFSSNIEVAWIHTPNLFERSKTQVKILDADEDLRGFSHTELNKYFVQ